ncbi:MAG: SIMPL domain-containing protein [Yoonia sp.]|nr:SIMPL domain-containing protein [Yoonia sp.]
MTLILRNLTAAMGMAILTFAPIGTAAEGVVPQITVTGEGAISVVPDMARITLGVVQQADTAADAMDAMSEAMRGVLAQLNDAGVDPKHIQTGNLRLDQMYDNSSVGQTKLTGYAAYADVQVQVYELDKLGAILDAAVRDGANHMNGLQFDVADRAPAMTAARQAAVADARAKAEVYTEAAGVALGPILLMSETGANVGPIPMMAEMAFDSGARALPVSAGEMTIAANVTMVWGLGE